MSKLEKFIQDNRSSFDSFEPRADLWQDIEKQLQKEASVRPLWFRQPVVRYAAAALVVLTVGYGIFQLGKYSGKGAQTTPALASINPELAQAEVYYTGLINEQKSMLNPEEIRQLGLEKDFGEDLATLDAAYQSLKKQLLTEPNKDPIVAAMIKNLQLRVEIIKQQIETLQRVRGYKKGDSKTV